MTGPNAEIPISAVDTAILGINATGQPYVVTLAGLLGPGGFVNAAGHPDIEHLIAFLTPRVEREPDLQHCPQRRDGRWWWVRMPVDISAHITVESAAGPGGFEALCGRAVMKPLPPDRPLWHITLAPAAHPGQCGIVVRLHHAVVDGTRATALLERLLGPEQVPSATTVAPIGTARPDSRGPTLPSRVRHGLHMFLRRPVRSPVLLGTVGDTRDVAAASVDLAELETAARAAGATVNDAYLVAVGQGLRAVLMDAGEPIPETLTVSVPVQVDSRGAAHNAVGVMLVAVPLTESVAALRTVARRTWEAKPLARASGTTIGSPRLVRMFNLFTRHQRVIATVASNVHGPRQPLTVDGAPMTEMWALGPLAGNVRVGFTAVSYAGRLSVGIESDADHLPPASRIADSVGRALQSIIDT
ncbi:wax ester/triacylglycerol synthase domain-containing protein [Nocardia sp. NPDC004151]|uniref:wax ester/triacylglycerol synthase domain-containing protein n=1 Tax=Nocardia sp. NPDC004151 TaxID=3364304 RepID=UPI0036859081